MKVFTRAMALTAALALSGCGGGECYVGVKGTANDTCKALIANPAKYVGDIAEDSAKDLYAMSERPTEPQVCEYTIDGRNFIVRDEGMLKVVGNVLCSGLAKRADRR